MCRAAGQRVTACCTRLHPTVARPQTPCLSVLWCGPPYPPQLPTAHVPPLPVSDIPPVTSQASLVRSRERRYGAELGSTCCCLQILHCSSLLHCLAAVRDRRHGRTDQVRCEDCERHISFGCRRGLARKAANSIREAFQAAPPPAAAAAASAAVAEAEAQRGPVRSDTTPIPGKRQQIKD